MDEIPEIPEIPPPDSKGERILHRTRRILFGKPRDFTEPTIFHRLSLIPILAWIGLGADGLSSSSYGPEEAFRALQGHTYLAFALAAATALTVVIIAVGYSRIIEEFPGGGGGYVVASRLLGEKLGVISGCALLVDYALTIAVSITAAGDSIFSTLPLEWMAYKFPLVIFIILGLTILNIRGVRESVLAMAPIFILFVLTHAVLIGVGIFSHTGNIPQVVESSSQSLNNDLGVLGLGGIFLILAKAFSMGGGTYTGIEAVSNGMPVLREPRVHTAKRTMLYMAVSLAITAGGLIVCYVLWGIAPEAGKTFNDVLAERISSPWPFHNLYVYLTLFAAGALLVVAAQAGFIGGPPVLANMAVDSWVPRYFSTLSERLTTMNGIVVMGAAALVLVFYTRGNTHHLVIMYSINVFLTFSLSMFGMLRLWWTRKGRVFRKRRLAFFTIGFLLCATILVITISEKFTEGGWVTVAITAVLVVICFVIRRHYRAVSQRLNRLNEDFQGLPIDGVTMPTSEMDPEQPTAAVLVSGFSGLGIHTLMNVFRVFPDQFKNIVFLSVGVIDSGEMKGAEQIQQLRTNTEESLQKYVKVATYLGIPSTYRLALGTDVVDEAVGLCCDVSKDFSRTTFFAGQLVFQHESWFHRLLHNQTAFSIQRRLLWEGKTMVVLPVRVR
ncbi:MAG: APC family permease [candidate division Zixibacteria bacterium]|nr:APC family permease [candidate division Zixibacteria bacterium]